MLSEYAPGPRSHISLTSLFFCHNPVIRNMTEIQVTTYIIVKDLRKKKFH